MKSGMKPEIKQDTFHDCYLFLPWSGSYEMIGTN